MDWFAPQDFISAWTHGLTMLGALPAGAVLVWKNRRDPGKLIGMSVFAVGLVVCFGSSGFYHAAPDGPRREALHLLDYLGIYLLIVGTVTPVALIVLRGWWRRWLLVQVWLLAITGAVLRLTIAMPQAVSMILYLLMGWVGVITYFELARRLSHAGVRPMWIGGLCYTVGAVLESLRWPDPWPGVFGHHELFHLFVMAGAACHYWFMLAVLTPYQAPAVAARTAGGTSPDGGERRDLARISRES